MLYSRNVSHLFDVAGPWKHHVLVLLEEMEGEAERLGLQDMRLVARLVNEEVEWMIEWEDI